MVTWLSATRVSEEGPFAGHTSLVLHDVAKNETVTLAAGEPGSGDPGGGGAGAGERPREGRALGTIDHVSSRALACP